MSAVSALDDVLGRIDKELHALEARANELRGARKVLLEIAGHVPSDPTPTAPPKPIDTVPARVNGRDLELKQAGLTIPDAAEIILRRAGEPLKARAIADRMLEGGFPYKNHVYRLRESIGSILRAKADADDTFTKVAPGTFALLEWQNGNRPHTHDQEDLLSGYENGATSR